MMASNSGDGSSSMRGRVQLKSSQMNEISCCVLWNMEDKDKGRRKSISFWDAPRIPPLRDVVEANANATYTMTWGGQQMGKSVIYLSQTSLVPAHRPRSE